MLSSAFRRFAPLSNTRQYAAVVRYAKSHEWVKVEDGVATVGITDHAQKELGELNYVELPAAGRVVKAGDSVAVVESVKTASDVYAPVSGKVTATNGEVAKDALKVNAAAETDGWLLKLAVTPDVQKELDALLSLDDYNKSIGA
eukprot:TRINITY_DN201_c0_g1_i1.p2 TRINITY_DN201_c0_g1~~TRINITY_DN201_c0_g1_i1.p2  ORF type:complete len:144 (-),score=38.50 TRINITY_DN201_c0_g1_i1:303-734(-)